MSYQAPSHTHHTSRIAIETTNDLTTRCENLNLNCENEPSVANKNTTNPKNKNAKKKGKLKQLQVSTTGSPAAHTQAATSNFQQSVPESFMTQISFLYARNSSSTQYIENLTHHPQYQYMYQMQQVNELYPTPPQTASIPNSPVVNFNNGSQSASIPNSPHVAHGLQDTPRFMQNIMQHPLLCQSVHRNVNYSQADTNRNKNFSPRRKMNNKKSTEKINDNKIFEPYWSKEDVDIGLSNNVLIEGVLRINPKQFQHSYVSSSDRSEKDILLDGIQNRNRAMEGDVVIVKLLDSDKDESEGNNKQKKGKVIFIKEKVHTRTCIGSLKLMADKNRQKALFVPRDHRIPRLNIPFTCWPDNFYQDAKAYENTLFLAKIEDWSDTRFAMGKIVCNIGQSGDMLTETKAILAQTDLNITPFGPEVRHLYPRLDYTIPTEELALREDCRNLCIFSIDPSNCRDIDDAVSCKELDNGNYEIGVHISDVSHFLTENTLLDQKVAEKATTIYLVEKAYHMLPDELCMLCSLFPGVDKLAFSVFWEITKDAQVISHRFSKTVIHSCCQLAYDHAQAILDDSKDSESIFPETYNGFKYQDIYKTIKIIGGIAAIFRKKRFEGGALRIDQPKVSFHLSTANGLPESYWIYESKESHQLIEEYMLLANMTVAKRIYDDHPKLAFLRCHPPPSDFMLNQLANALKPMGIDLNISTAGDLHHSLMKYVGPESTDKGRAMVLNMLCAKPMTRARYFCSNGCDDEDFHHYALNVPLYTHFTSPIRRYADIMVHRLLSASLNYRENPKWEVDKVRMVAAQCNKQKYNAKKAGEMSTELYTLKYIELNSPLVTDAVVVEVRERYIDVIVVAMGLNRRIFFNNDFPGEFLCVKHDGGTKLSKMEVTWHAVDNLPKIKQTIEVFSILNVELIHSDDMIKVETKLARPTYVTPEK